MSCPVKSPFTAIVILAICSCSLDKAPAPSSEYPIAVDLKMVGKYPARSKSGGGYFYDGVLEYRVWIDSEGGDYYHAFATYEEAEDFASRTDNAEEPLVLVVQYEHVNEPQPGVYEHVKGRRVTEWRVDWLAGNKRKLNSINEFLREHSNSQVDGRQK